MLVEMEALEKVETGGGRWPGGGEGEEGGAGAEEGQEMKKAAGP